MLAVMRLAAQINNEPCEQSQHRLQSSTTKMFARTCGRVLVCGVVRPIVIRHSFVIGVQWDICLKVKNTVALLTYKKNKTCGKKKALWQEKE